MSIADLAGGPTISTRLQRRRAARWRHSAACGAAGCGGSDQDGKRALRGSSGAILADVRGPVTAGLRRVAGRSCRNVGAAYCGSGDIAFADGRRSDGALGTPGSVSPFDSAAFDDRVFDSLFAAVIPSAPSSAPSGPSLPGFGASPTELAGQAGAQSAPTQSSVPASAPGIGPPVTGAPVSAADVSVIDLAGVNTLTRTPDPLLPSSVDAGPSLSGFGASKGIPARPEQSRSADSLPGVRSRHRRSRRQRHRRRRS